jgi:hypothetical protein
MGAVQAQDYLASLWAVGLRTRDATQADVERAIDERAIVRTHFMRNTVHLVPAEDLCWMVRLMAPRIRMIIDNIARAGRLGLDEKLYARSNAVIADALAGGRRLTRATLAAALAAAGVRTDGRLTLLTQRAQTDGLVCHGPRRGAHYTLVLVDEWLPAGRSLGRDEALAEFARRYFRGHGPATLHDYAWWSGLTVADARAGLEAVRPELQAETVGGREYWYAEPPAAPPAADGGATAHLLPNYDEFTVGYRDRSAVFDDAYRPMVTAPTNNILFVNAVVVDGEVVGQWRRTKRKDSVALATESFRGLTVAESGAVRAAAARYGAFVDRPVALTT